MAIKTVETFEKIQISISSISILAVSSMMEAYVEFIFIHLLLSEMYTRKWNMEEIRKYGTLNGAIKSLRFSGIKIVLDFSAVY